MNAAAIIIAACESMMEYGDEFGEAHFTDDEAAIWLRSIADKECFLSVHYNDRDGKWYPCLRA